MTTYGPGVIVGADAASGYYNVLLWGAGGWSSDRQRSGLGGAAATLNPNAVRFTIPTAPGLHCNTAYGDAQCLAVRPSGSGVGDLTYICRLPYGLAFLSGDAIEDCPQASALPLVYAVLTMLRETRPAMRRIIGEKMASLQSEAEAAAADLRGEVDLKALSKQAHAKAAGAVEKARTPSSMDAADDAGADAPAAAEAAADAKADADEKAASLEQSFRNAIADTDVRALLKAGEERVQALISKVQAQAANAETPKEGLGLGLGITEKMEATKSIALEELREAQASLGVFLGIEDGETQEARETLKAGQGAMLRTWNRLKDLAAQDKDLKRILSKIEARSEGVRRALAELRETRAAKTLKAGADAVKSELESLVSESSQTLTPLAERSKNFLDRVREEDSVFRTRASEVFERLSERFGEGEGGAKGLAGAAGALRDAGAGAWADKIEEISARLSGGGDGVDVMKLRADGPRAQSVLRVAAFIDCAVLEGWDARRIFAELLNANSKQVAVGTEMSEALKARAAEVGRDSVVSAVNLFLRSKNWRPEDFAGGAWERHFKVIHVLKAGPQVGLRLLLRPMAQSTADEAQRALSYLGLDSPPALAASLERLAAGDSRTLLESILRFSEDDKLNSRLQTFADTATKKIKKLKKSLGKNAQLQALLKHLGGSGGARLEQTLLAGAEGLDVDRLLEDFDGAFRERDKRQKLVDRAKNAALNFFLDLLPGLEIPPVEGESDGIEFSVGNLDLKGLTLDKEDVRVYIRGLTNPAPPSSARARGSVAGHAAPPSLGEEHRSPGPGQARRPSAPSGTAAGSKSIPAESRSTTPPAPRSPAAAVTPPRPPPVSEPAATPPPPVTPTAEPRRPGVDANALAAGEDELFTIVAVHLGARLPGLKWSFRQNYFPFLNGAGSADAVVLNAQVRLGFKLYKYRLAAGEQQADGEWLPIMLLSSAAVDMEDMDIMIQDDTFSWLYNALLNIFRSEVRDYLCTAVELELRESLATVAAYMHKFLSAHWPNFLRISAQLRGAGGPGFQINGAIAELPEAPAKLMGNVLAVLREMDAKAAVLPEVVLKFTEMEKLGLALNARRAGAGDDEPQAPDDDEPLSQCQVTGIVPNSQASRILLEVAAGGASPERSENLDMLLASAMTSEQRNREAAAASDGQSDGAQYRLILLARALKNAYLIKVNKEDVTEYDGEKTLKTIAAAGRPMALTLQPVAVATKEEAELERRRRREAQAQLIQHERQRRREAARRQIRLRMRVKAVRLGEGPLGLRLRPHPSVPGFVFVHGFQRAKDGKPLQAEESGAVHAGDVLLGVGDVKIFVAGASGQTALELAVSAIREAPRPLRLVFCRSPDFEVMHLPEGVTLPAEAGDDAAALAAERAAFNDACYRQCRPKMAENAGVGQNMYMFGAQPGWVQGRPATLRLEASNSRGGASVEDDGAGAEEAATQQQGTQVVIKGWDIRGCASGGRLLDGAGPAAPAPGGATPSPTAAAAAAGAVAAPGPPYMLLAINGKTLGQILLHYDRSTGSPAGSPAAAQLRKRAPNRSSSGDSDGTRDAKATMSVGKRKAIAAETFLYMADIPFTLVVRDHEMHQELLRMVTS
mmetsp:Transcript_14054/g.41934  ORF Transcript_14054/g.41934 Transcript_14054/m.41934 type:complete len:1595 (+) Transcript_14054:713-5497(+)